MIYTAQYRYSGRDRLDITIKGNDPAGRLYAPTWDMVKGIKDGTMSEESYTAEYYALLIERWRTGAKEMLKLIEIVNGTATMPERDITLVCFCPAYSFCHRYLLANFLHHNWKVGYGGERTL